MYVRRTSAYAHVRENVYVRVKVWVFGYVRVVCLYACVCARSPVRKCARVYVCTCIVCMCVPLLLQDVYQNIHSVYIRATNRLAFQEDWKKLSGK